MQTVNVFTLVTPDRPQLTGDDTVGSVTLTQILLTICHLAISIQTEIEAFNESEC